MALILNIDTAIDIAYVTLAKDGEIIATINNKEQKEHGGFLQPAIQKLILNNGYLLKNLDAIAISAGPGSYTGLRVGMATAKGLCYTLNKPLISVITLEILACSALLEYPETLDVTTLLCPLIDARRMEVYTAMYDLGLKTVINPCAIVLTENYLANEMLNHQVIFCGNGAKKFKEICNNINAIFFEILNNPLAMSKLAEKKFNHSDFSNLAYIEPYYIKEFFVGK